MTKRASLDSECSANVLISTRRAHAEHDEPVHLVQRDGTDDRFLIYSDKSGVRVELRYEGEALWMSQSQMAELFGINVRTISEHLQNVYREGELDESATLRNFRIVRSEGGRSVAREIIHYNLDAVIKRRISGEFTKGNAVSKVVDRRFGTFRQQGLRGGR